MRSLTCLCLAPRFTRRADTNRPTSAWKRRAEYRSSIIKRGNYFWYEVKQRTSTSKELEPWFSQTSSDWAVGFWLGGSDPSTFPGSGTWNFGEAQGSSFSHQGGILRRRKRRKSPFFGQDRKFFVSKSQEFSRFLGVFFVLTKIFFVFVS